MRDYNILGIDLAKNVIQVCVIDKHGEYTSNKAMSSKKVKEMLVNAKPSLFVLEGCDSSYY